MRPSRRSTASSSPPARTRCSRSPDETANAVPPAEPVAVTATLFKEDSPEPDVPFRQVTTLIPAAEEAG